MALSITANLPQMNTKTGNGLKAAMTAYDTISPVKKGQITMIRLILLFTALVFIAFYLTAPSADDIARCKTATGWNESRCTHELNR